MYASVRVEGKLLEVLGGDEGAFPFRVMETSRRRRVFVKLTRQEYRWLAVEMVRFCSSKGEPLWVRTFKGANRCLLLQLRQNSRGRFIVFSLLGNFGRARTIIFPEGMKAEGWFSLTNLLKESLVGGKGENYHKQWERPVASKARMGRPQSYTEAVRGRNGDPQSSHLRGWRCKQCGSWDVFAAVLGEEKVSVSGGHKQHNGEERVQSRGKGTSVEVEIQTGSPARNDGQNNLRLDSNDGANQFQMLSELLGDCPSADGNSVAGDTVVPESALGEVVGDHAQRSPCYDLVVYSRREKGKEKVLNVIGSGSTPLLGCGGVNTGVGVTLGHDQGDELDRPETPHCQFPEDGGASSDWVLDRIILFCKRMGLAIEGKEMELLSFLATIDSLGNKANLSGKEKGREHEEGERSLFDGELC